MRSMKRCGIWCVRAKRRGKRDRLEGPASLACAVWEADGQGQEQGSGGHSGRTRVTRIYLGYWRTGGSAAEGILAASGLRKSLLEGSQEAAWVAVEVHTKENPRSFYAVGLRPNPRL